ncbi:MAG: nucleotidyltransferase family protein [Ruminococcaceae bacterium]|nr:nucleotidyltransferase family protein [Oscillospiraceae bacterium]
MDCIILAAGYATRLYPLTEKMPKPLLKVQEKTILDWLIDDISKSGRVDRYIVVSNHKFASHFEQWAKEKNSEIPIVVLDDKTESNETRLGAVADILFAVKELHITGETMVIAGDNVLDFSLCRMIEYFDKKKCSCIMRYFEPDTKRCQSSGVVEIDEQDQILSMEEKPAYPKSNWVTPPFYLYTGEDIAMLEQALQDGCGKDAPGSFPAYLCIKKPVYAMEMPGKRYDIGNLASYETVQKTYCGIVK